MRINNQVSLVEREGCGSPFFCWTPRLRGGARKFLFKTKDSQARFRFVKFFRVAKMSQAAAKMSQSNNKI